MQNKKLKIFQLKKYTHWDIMVMAHSMGVISLRITSSVRSSGQWATKLRMATEERRSGKSYTYWHFRSRVGLQGRSVIFTAQCSSSTLQGDLPGEGVSSGLFCLQLLLGARKHVPPQEQHFGEVVTHKGGTWEHTEYWIQVPWYLVRW